MDESQVEDSIMTQDESQVEDSIMTQDESQVEHSIMTQDESQVEHSIMTQDDDFPSLDELEAALPKVSANNEEEKTNDPQFTDEETRTSIAEQVSANNEEEKTNDPQFTDEETRMSIADQELFKRRAFRESKLGLHQSYPIIWIGDLFFANLEVRVAFKFIYGDIAVFKEAVPPCTVAFPGIRLKYKQQFDDVPKEDLKQKMQAKKGSCVLIAVPLDLHVKQCNRMEKRFIPCFKRQGIVGVSHFPRDGIPEKMKKTAQASGIATFEGRQPKKMKKTIDERSKKTEKTIDERSKKTEKTIDESFRSCRQKAFRLSGQVSGIPTIVGRPMKKTSDEQSKKRKKTIDEQSKKMVKTSDKQSKKMEKTSDDQSSIMETSTRTADDDQSSIMETSTRTADDQSSIMETSTRTTHDDQSSKVETSTRATDDEQSSIMETSTRTTHDDQSSKVETSTRATDDEQSSIMETSTRTTNDEQSSIMETSTRTTNDELVSKQTKYEMKFFRPSKFVYQNLLPIAPTLAKRLYKDPCPYLMIVISNFMPCDTCVDE